MLETVQIIKEKNKPKFAILAYQEFLEIKELLSNEHKLEDFLDYLHIQNVKSKNEDRHSLDDVKKMFEN